MQIQPIFSKDPIIDVIREPLPVSFSIVATAAIIAGLAIATIGVVYLTELAATALLIAGLAIVTLGATHLIKKFFFNEPYHSCRTIALSPEHAMEKMLRNSEKAMNEHRQKEGAYASTSQALPTKEFLLQKESTPLKLTHTFADDIGPRDDMEDAHFFKEIEQGTLIGIFDGHGGKAIANYASEEFQKRFSATLKAHDGDAFRAFEVLIHEIHQEVAQKPEWDHMGSTAVVSFIDKETHQIITATLGDSEANLYRSGQSIALSTVRDWTCKKEVKRLINAHGEIAEKWIKRVRGAAKMIRSHLNHGVNVSRAIGDVAETGTLQKPLVIHKPKITINKLQKGDVLVLACDGLKDYVPEKEIADTVYNASALLNKISSILFSYKPKSLARELVNAAINRKALDNVTVIAVEVL